MLILRGQQHYASMVRRRTILAALLPAYLDLGLGLLIAPPHAPSCCRINEFPPPYCCFVASPPARRWPVSTAAQTTRPFASEPLSSAAEATSSDVITSGREAVRSQRPSHTTSPSLQMLSFYCFRPIDDPCAVRDGLFERLSSIEGLRGTAYVAHEGINAQFAVPPGLALRNFLDACVASLPFDPFEENPVNLGDVVDADTPTFDRLIVRTRDYILRGGPEDDGGGCGGRTYDWSDAGVELEPSEWDSQLRTGVAESSQGGDDSPEPLIIDVRNEYETQSGTFRNAVPLDTSTYAETWSRLDDLVGEVDRSQPLHIFCTGGIRCVKAGAYLKQQLGFKDVRRLRHGIVGYQRWEAEANAMEGEEDGGRSMWNGDNFLFDKRRFVDKEREMDKRQ